MLRGAVTSGVVSGVGDVFVMKMFYAPIGEYQMDNHVIDYEQDRRIGWEPAAGHGHPDGDDAECEPMGAPVELRTQPRRPG